MLWSGAGRPLAAAIAGHHGRLPDPDRLRARISGAENVPLPDWCQLPEWNWPARIRWDKRHAPYRLQFLTRMLYGALCDADDRETAAFYGGQPDPAPWEITSAMRDEFHAYMAGLGGTGPVNDLRRRVLDHARGMAR